MYLQITTRCNMACAHCCFACRPGMGKDMDDYVFYKACELTLERGSALCLGGGEPTIHPKFWRFLRRAIDYAQAVGDRLLIITNGKETKTALRLARLCEEGVIWAELSQDPWHEPISPRVVHAFQQLRPNGHGSGIRSNTRITPHGSALVNGLAAESDRCCCENLLVHPNGTIFGCGCRKVRFGTVFNPRIPEDFAGDCAVKQYGYKFDANHRRPVGSEH